MASNPHDDPSTMTIRTSEKDWFARLATAYRDRTELVLIDDAGVGIDPKRDTLAKMARRAVLGPAQIAGALISLGVAATGVGLVVMAILDPEPFSKLGLTIAAGTVMTMGGGFMAVRVLTDLRPPTVQIGPRGFVISFQ